MKIFAGALIAASGVAAWEGGVHVHVGFNCTVPGGHYWKPTTDPDPWNAVKYTARADGTSHQTIKVSNSGLTNADLGTDVAGTDRVFVVHDEDGTKVSCTVPDTVDGWRTDMGTYPDYAGDLTVTGQVGIAPMGNDVYMWLSLVGLEASETGGVHVHTGTTCANASLVGGHYWTPETVPDVWNDIKWISEPNGNSFSSFVVSGSGYTAEEMSTHAVVVHDSNGARIGCATLPNATNVQVHGGTMSKIPGYDGDVVVTGTVYVTGGSPYGDDLYVRTNLANLNPPATGTTAPESTGTPDSASTSTFGVAALVAGLFARFF